MYKKSCAARVKKILVCCSRNIPLRLSDTALYASRLIGGPLAARPAFAEDRGLARCPARPRPGSPRGSAAGAARRPRRRDWTGTRQAGRRGTRPPPPPSRPKRVAAGISPWLPSPTKIVCLRPNPAPVPHPGLRTSNSGGASNSSPPPAASPPPFAPKANCSACGCAQSSEKEGRCAWPGAEMCGPSDAAGGGGPRGPNLSPYGRPCACGPRGTPHDLGVTHGGISAQSRPDLGPISRLDVEADGQRDGEAGRESAWRAHAEQVVAHA